MPLDLTSAKFSLANARELALYARMAYDEPPTITAVATDTQVLIRDLGDCVVVSPRGTSCIRDFVTDAEAWRVKTTGGEYHAGGWKAWLSVRDQVYSALPARKPILFGAHSLGAMISNFAAKSLRDSNFNVHSVYTFGCPRSGNNVFQSGYNATPVPGSPFANLASATFNIINDCDIVPRVPGWLAGYRRPGLDEFIPDGGGQIVEEPSVLYRLDSDVISLAQAWWGKRSPAFLDELLLDHHIDNYIDALNGIEPEAAQ